VTIIWFLAQLEFLPPNERKEEVFEAHFNGAGLDKIVRYHRSKQQGRLKGELRGQLKDVLERGDTPAEVTTFLKEFQRSNDVGDDIIVITFWTIMMGTVEWSRKASQADMLEKEALRHIKVGVNSL
jgi:hypothetical protein